MLNSAKQSILIVEDQAGERQAMRRLLRTEGYLVHVASSLTEAKSMTDASIDLVITDLRLGRQSGIELLGHWHATRPSTPFIFVTAYGDIETAVEAMKLGALDYLTKPLQPEELLVLLNRYLPMRNRLPIDENSSGVGLGRLIGNSEPMLRVFDAIQKVSRSNSTVLITGESGTGKELVASAIHENSSRSEHPYVAVNVAAFPDALIEAELFGHTKSAFTGAADMRQGRFHAADKGTLFMDEIGDFPLALQPKLLRVLENFSFARVGSNHEEQVDVRLIAATSRNLLEMVDQRIYRADLFHRINVLTIELPPLRDRPEDIDALVGHFIRDCAKRHLRNPPEVTAELMSFFKTYDWPGNVRQLRNTIENMFVLGEPGQLTIQDLPKYLSGSANHPISSIDTNQLNLMKLERETILNALSQSMGNRSHAAHKLGISIRTLQRKLKQWSVDKRED